MCIAITQSRMSGRNLEKFVIARIILYRELYILRLLHVLCVSYIAYVNLSDEVSTHR